jgi:hypothetical protein
VYFPALYAVFLQVSIKWRVEIVDIVKVPFHSLGNIVRAPHITRSAMLIAAYIHEPGDHIIVRTVDVADGDIERCVCGVRIVWHGAFFHVSENLKIEI